MSDEREPAARDLALAALARREHSRRELEVKLETRGIAHSEIAAVLDGLAQSGLQDDGRFAEAYLRYRAGRGYGPMRIVQELRQRGVASADIEDAFAVAEVDWAERARGERVKKFRDRPQSLPERARQTRFLQYRGFASEHIRYALEKSTDDDNF